MPFIRCSGVERPALKFRMFKGKPAEKLIVVVDGGLLVLLRDKLPLPLLESIESKLRIHSGSTSNGFGKNAGLSFRRLRCVDPRQLTEEFPVSRGDGVIFGLREYRRCLF